ncbi:hypothetical protein Fmac_026687 [Flemingia macrophylla]|uniref:Aminotransferase-like plant mobile domain-containing protein n=1 Tax=Flemingia macrophylla TaxID=520843 RepID=A0ABD1LG51_9FABA
MGWSQPWLRDGDLKHTFHFPTGECTITLEDVALQLGLRVDGLPVVGPTMFDWEEMCDTYLGIMPVKGESLVGSMLKLKWLRDNMLPLPDDPTEEQVHAHCRAYILGLISGVLMPDKSGNKVHLMYLSLLTNLSRTRYYSWGSVCLSILYRELCKATEVGTRTMGDCSSLLMSWALYRMSYKVKSSIN